MISVSALGLRYTHDVVLCYAALPPKGGGFGLQSAVVTVLLYDTQLGSRSLLPVVHGACVGHLGSLQPNLYFGRLQWDHCQDLMAGFNNKFGVQLGLPTWECHPPSQFSTAADNSNQ